MPAFDYAGPGAYFVTLVAQGRACLFGSVRDGQVELTPAGQIVASCWASIPAHFAHVALDAFVVLPNHVHGVLLITDSSAVGAQHAAPLLRESPPIGGAVRGVAPNSLAAIVRSFKSAATRAINLLRGTPGGAVWQRNYYEHVVRNPDDLNAIRRYIADNPMRWELDEENPGRLR